MSRQVRHRNKGLAAGIASERFFSGVCHHVSLELPGLREGFAAVCALPLPLLQVRLLVLLHVGRRDERPRAHVTFVRSFTSVRLFVLVQVGRLGKRFLADVAHIRFIPCVTPHVLIQLRLPLEPPATQITRTRLGNTASCCQSVFLAHCICLQLTGS